MNQIKRQKCTEHKTEMHGSASKTKLLYPKLSYQVRGAIFAVYKTLGPYHKESVYANALSSELKKRKIPFTREKSINVSYRYPPRLRGGSLFRSVPRNAGIYLYRLHVRRNVGLFAFLDIKVKRLESIGLTF